MKKLLTALLTAACLVSSISPVQAANTFTFYKNFNTELAKFKGKADFHYDAVTGKMVCKKGYYTTTSMELKNVPYMNQCGGSGGLYKWNGDPTKSSSYTHKKWQRDSLYKKGVGGSCGCYSFAMGVSFQLGRIVPPYIYREDGGWLNSKELGYDASYINEKYKDRLLGHIRQRKPLVLCVNRTHNCPFTNK